MIGTSISVRFGTIRQWNIRPVLESIGWCDKAAGFASRRLDGQYWNAKRPTRWIRSQWGRIDRNGPSHDIVFRDGFMLLGVKAPSPNRSGRCNRPMANIMCSLVRCDSWHVVSCVLLARTVELHCPEIILAPLPPIRNTLAGSLMSLEEKVALVVAPAVASLS